MGDGICDLLRNELVWGALISLATSLGVSWFFYTKATKDLKETAAELRRHVGDLEKVVRDAKHTSLRRDENGLPIPGVVYDETAGEVRVKVTLGGREELRRAEVPDSSG